MHRVLSSQQATMQYQARCAVGGVGVRVATDQDGGLLIGPTRDGARKPVCVWPAVCVIEPRNAAGIGRQRYESCPKVLLYSNVRSSRASKESHARAQKQSGVFQLRCRHTVTVRTRSRLPGPPILTTGPRWRRRSRRQVALHSAPLPSVHVLAGSQRR